MPTLPNLPPSLRITRDHFIIVLRKLQQSST